MKEIHRACIAFLMVVFFCINFNKITANAEKTKDYLALVQQKDGSWKAYTKCIELSDNNNLMVRAWKISKAAGLTYKKGKDSSFVIQKDTVHYNTYMNNSITFQSTQGTQHSIKRALAAACVSKQSKCNLCAVNSLDTLVYYRCFRGLDTKEYKKYDKVVCFSQYEAIPESVSIVESGVAKAPAPEPEPPFMSIEGIQFPVRTSFLPKKKALSDWGGTAPLWSELAQELNGKIIKSTILWYDSNQIKFSHQGVDGEGVSLIKGKEGYKLAISVRLDGSETAKQNASIVKAMITTISSQPTTVYQAVYDSFTSTQSHGIKKDGYVVIGDCKVKIGTKDGVVTYYIKQK